MKQFLIPLFCVLTSLPARAANEQTPGTALLLDEKTAFALTADYAQYEKLPTLKGKLVSAGSGLVTILINRWASEFAALYPEVVLDIQGGGSDASLADFVAGKVDFMPMSRPLAADELALFTHTFGYAPAQVEVAQDAVGIYVHKNNPVAGLTLAELDGIYSGDPKHGTNRPELWRDLHVEGPLGEELLMRFALGSVQGTHRFFRDAVLSGADYRFDVRFENLSSSLVQSVGANEAGIGFASVMWATARSRFVPVKANDGYWLPSFENVVSGNYPLVRRMRIVFNRKPDGSMNPVAREFLRFAVSRRGQRIIALALSYPLTLEQQREALRVIGTGP